MLSSLLLYRQREQQGEREGANVSLSATTIEQQSIGDVCRKERLTPLHALASVHSEAEDRSRALC